MVGTSARVFGMLTFAKPYEKREILIARLIEHERAHWQDRFFKRFFLRDTIVQKRIERFTINLIEKRRHDKHGQKQRKPDEQLIRWHLLRSQRLAYERKHDNDAREGRHHD